MAMATNLLRLSLSMQPKPVFDYCSYRRNVGFDFLSFLSSARRRGRGRRAILRPVRDRNVVVSNSLETRIDSRKFNQPNKVTINVDLKVFADRSLTWDDPVFISKREGDNKGKDSGSAGSFRNDVRWLCFSCQIYIDRQEIVESAVINMLTETAAVRLGKVDNLTGNETVAEHLASRLTECGFPSKRRVSGLSMMENVRKWTEISKKKEELLVKSRNRVAFAWTLVALCCGSHASHFFHSLGIHIAHGPFWEVLHNSYLKGVLALVALLGTGRDLIFDGLRSFKKGSPNMNSLVGFGSLAAFVISSISLLNPRLQWDASFFDEPVMLLGFVLLGRSLEEKARIKASSDMNELLSLISTQSRLVIGSSEDSSPNDVLISADAMCLEVPTDDIRAGDAVLVLPGETIPIDGCEGVKPKLNYKSIREFPCQI